MQIVLGGCCDERIIDAVISKTDLQIALLVVDNDNIANKYKMSTKINRMVTLAELLECKDKCDIDFEIVEKFKYTFPRCDYGLRRIDDNFPFVHYVFYTAICFWNNYFKNEHIDGCIIYDMYHGLPYDYIMEEVAKNYKIPCYHIYYVNFNKFAVFDVMCGRKIKLNEDLISDNAEESAYYSDNLNLDEISGKCKKVKRILYNIGGCRFMMFTELLFLKKRTIFHHTWSLKPYMNACKSIDKVLKRNKTLYSNPVPNEKYVIFFLHFEPEATVVTYGQYVESQLVLIKMLADALPTGWKLYVKEHPDMYRLNKMLFANHYPVAHTYINEYFFKKIMSFDHIKLIDYHVSASDLIANSQVVSTLAGTVATEAILKRKPLITFFSEESIYIDVQDCLCAKTTKDCKDYFYKVQTGFNPDYSDYYSIRQKYLENADDKGLQHIVKIIQEKINNE